jgi:ssRNA-specific RNase YbeY (16S rRNA maturation enzyme)
VHGALHLVGYDHETDDGSMLRRQEQLVREVAPVVADPA